MGAPVANPNPAVARAEYEAATQGLYFAKDFRTWDAVIQDRMATAGERVYAWIRRRSWGYYRLYCINEDGTPAFQRDCAKELGLNKSTVSHTVSYLEGRGYIRTQGKLMYPVLTPVLLDLEGVVKKLEESATFLQSFRHFFANWKESHSTEYAELEVARSTIKRIRKVALSDYRRLRRSSTKPGPILIESSESKEERSPPPPLTPPPVESVHEEEEPPPSIVEPPTPPVAAEVQAVAAEVIPASPNSWETFKSLYPKERLDWKAKAKFKAMPAPERIHALRQLIRYMQSERWNDQDGRWIPNASNWLETYEVDPPPLIRIASAAAIKMEASMNLTKATLHYLKRSSGEKT